MAFAATRIQTIVLTFPPQSKKDRRTLHFALAAGLIFTYWEPIKAFFIKLWAGVVEAFGPVLDGIMEALQPVIDYLVLLKDTFMGIFNGIIDFVVGVFTGDLDKAFGGLTQIFESVKGYFLGVFDMITSQFEGLVDLVKGGLSFFGFGGDDEEKSKSKWKGMGPEIISPLSKGGEFAPPVSSSMPQGAGPGGVDNTFKGDMQISVLSNGPEVKIDHVTSNNSDMKVKADVGRRAFPHGV